MLQLKNYSSEESTCLTAIKNIALKVYIYTLTINNKYSDQNYSNIYLHIQTKINKIKNHENKFLNTFQLNFNFSTTMLCWNFPKKNYYTKPTISHCVSTQTICDISAIANKIYGQHFPSIAFALKITQNVQFFNHISHNPLSQFKYFCNCKKFIS